VRAADPTVDPEQLDAVGLSFQDAFAGGGQADLRPGDAVVVRLAMNVVIGIERPATGA